VIDRRQEAVDRLSALLERDELALEEYRGLVDRVLATTSDSELDLILATVPAMLPAQILDDDALVIENGAGVAKQTPGRLAATTELRNDTGVMKIDFRWAQIDGDEIDLEIENNRGVVKVVLPADVAVELVEHRAGGGVFKNRTHRPMAEQGAPLIRLHVVNDTGVINVIKRRRRGRRA
jgi:hypothetical protein